MTFRRMPKKPKSRKAAKRKPAKKTEDKPAASVPAPQVLTEKNEAPRGFELSPYQ